MDVALCDHFAPLATGNFSGMWDELGEENEVEETYALSSMKTLEGKRWLDQVRLSFLALFELSVVCFPQHCSDIGFSFFFFFQF